MTKPSAPAQDQTGDRAALLIIDMINDFDFKSANRIKPHAMAAARVIADLRAQADSCDCPVIYVNDNFGEWHSERSRLVERALKHDNPVSALLVPREEDFFVIKPQFSGFYATNLPVLLPKLGVRRLVLTGIATDICILFTAADAHMRDYKLWIPQNAVAAENDMRSRWALEIIRNSMGGMTQPTTQKNFMEWAGHTG